MPSVGTPLAGCRQLVAHINEPLQQHRWQWRERAAAQPPQPLHRQNTSEQRAVAIAGPSWPPNAICQVKVNIAKGGIKRIANGWCMPRGALERPKPGTCLTARFSYNAARTGRPGTSLQNRLVCLSLRTSTSPKVLHKPENLNF